MELDGKVALITGAARRIGAGLALALARQGMHIALHHGHSHDEATLLAAKIRRLGRRAEIFAADLADPAQTTGLLANVTHAMGTATVLVNNAAIFEPGHLLDTPPLQWQRHLDINLTAPFLLMGEFARQVAGHYGKVTSPVAKVVNIVDQRIIHPRPGHLAYTVAKSALWTLTTLCARELAPAILVNAVGPGPILATDPNNMAQFHQVAATTPVGKPGSIDDLAATVVFLLQQDYLTGQLIHVDGGQHLT